VSLDLDHELSRLEQAMVERHLARCTACRTFRDDLVAITGTLRETPPLLLEHPIVVRRQRRSRLATVHVAAVRVSAVAAGIALVLALGLDGRDVVGPDPLRSNPTLRPAYLDSPDYEKRVIQHVRDTRLAQRISRAV